MVYGEFAQEKPVELSKKLVNLLPSNLNSVYLVNSGTESIEAAIKLVKKVTQRPNIIAIEGCYHGNTNGSLSLVGKKDRKIPFTPLIPGISHIPLNSISALDQINATTAAVFIETIQGDAGVRIPTSSYLQALRKKCTETGARLVFDEIQTGMGRTGKMFAFEHYNVIPDVLCLGKALGGGLPIGALISSKENMSQLANNPVLGHITTFGGHPLPAATGIVAIDIISKHLDEVDQKGQYIEDELIQLSKVKEIRRKGLMMAIDMENADIVNEVVSQCRAQGLLSFWFLSCPWSFRLSPPLTISWEDLKKGVEIIKTVINN